MKRIIVSLIVLVASFNCATAQLSQSIFNSSNQQLVEMAVKDGIVLLRQDYQLLDTVSNTRYGWNYQEIFNSVYSVGFKVEGGYVVNERFIKPWKFDTRYKELQDTTYVPVVFKAYGKSMADSLATEIEYNIENQRTVKDKHLYRVDSLAHEDRGFVTDTTLGEKEGWIVWVTSSDSLLNENSKLSVVAYRHKITIEENKNEYLLPKPATSKKILAGILVVPQKIKVGVIDFKVIGYAYNKNLEWFIVKETVATVAQPQEGAAMLTPVVANDDEAAEEETESQKKKSKKNKKSKKDKKRK